MAFDGITVAALAQELQNTLPDGRINKIAQPEADELLLTIKTPQGQRRLGKRFPPTHISYRRKQKESYDSPEFLHASAQAYRRRQNCGYYPAGAGAHSLFSD